MNRSAEEKIHSYIGWEKESAYEPWQFIGLLPLVDPLQHDITENKDGAYSGEDHAPAFDAAYSAASPGDMKAPTAAGAKGNDGRVWTPAM